MKYIYMKNDKGKEHMLDKRGRWDENSRVDRYK